MAVDDGTLARPQFSPPPPRPAADGSGVSTSPRLGALFEVPQLLLVVIVVHLHIAIWLTQILHEGSSLNHPPTHTRSIYTHWKLFIEGLVATLKQVELRIVELWEGHAVLFSVKFSHES